MRAWSVMMMRESMTKETLAVLLVVVMGSNTLLAAYSQFRG